MYWHKRDVWKAGSAIAGIALFLILMVWVPLSAAGTYERGLESPAPGKAVVQTTPTEDVTVAAETANENLIKLQRDNDRSLSAWIWNNGAVIVSSFLSTVVIVIGALFGYRRWRVDRREAQEKDARDRQTAQDKELKDRAEERFKTAVTALGDEKESVQLGGAVLLQSFLNQDDKKSYERYYTQIFNLAVAYLRLPRTSHPPEDSDGIPHSLENSNALLPLTALNLTLFVVFKEAFPLAREERKRNFSPFYPRSLDASRVKLDGAYLAHADLSQAWMREASLREAWITQANLCKADLREANFTRADLTDTCLEDAFCRKACFKGADLRRACLKGADLSATNLSGANLSGANLSRVIFRPGGSRGGRDSTTPADLSGARLIGATLIGADLREAILSKANLRETNLEDAQTLEGTDLRGVIGLTKEQLAACKAKGAIIDEDSTAILSQSSVSPSLFWQNNDAQAP